MLMVPLPLAERIGPLLEGWTATSATAFVQLLGVPAQNIGAQVLLPNSAFAVGLPCGGLRSVIAIITLVTLWAFLAQGRAIARGLVFLAAIPIALAANTLRISLLFAIASSWGAEAGMDYFHSWSSPVLFVCAFGLLLMIAKMVGCWNVRWEAVLPA
jgi:exosortase